MQHLDQGVQFMKLCLGRGWTMWSPILCLNNLVAYHGTVLGFYALKRNCQESSKWFGMRLATGHKMKTETRIEEPSSLLDSQRRILSKAPLTPGSNPLEAVFFIDFDN